MKNLFLRVVIFFSITHFITSSEIIWNSFGGQTSMTGQNPDDNAGNSVAMSSDGTIIVVGEDGWSGLRGRVRTYSLQNGIWTEFGGATSMTGSATGDQAGSSLDINSEGSIVVVGEDGWSGFSGRVRTYRLQNGVWNQFGGSTSMTGSATGDQAGFSVAINADGNIIAVGEVGWSGSRGRVRTYSLQSGVWTEFGGSTSMTGQNANDAAGYSLGINSDGTIIAVGEDDWNGSRGRVRTYSLQSGVWTEFGGSTSMTGQNTNDGAGYSLGINSDGTIIAVGEDGWNGSRGRVRTYSLQNGVWTEFGGVTSMTGQNANDYAGSFVAISSDGTILAVGEDGWSGGNGPGRVRTYKLQNNVWTEFGGSTSMTGQNANDGAGVVAMNSRGSIIAVGQEGWSGGNGPGRVVTYSYPESLSDLIPSENGIRNQHLGEGSHGSVTEPMTRKATSVSAAGQGAHFGPVRHIVQGK